MSRHAWISAVLDDMIDYALRNELAEVRNELSRTADRLAPILDREDDTEPVDAVCDVIAMPATRA